MRIIPIATAFFLTTSAFAQSAVHVIQVNIIPPTPTTFDTVKIATITSTPYLGESYGLSSALSGDTIHVIGCFLAGALAQPKVYYDTISIGILPSGIYHVIYEARASGTGVCDTLYDNDWGQVDFTVGFMSIGEQDGNQGIYLFPNPGIDIQTISLNGIQNQNIRIDLFDAQGRLIRGVYKGVVLSNEAKIDIDVSNLSPAPYFYRIHYGTYTRTLRFVKQ